MFKSIPLDAKFDDIQDCFDPLKYIFPSDCKIKISLLEDVEKKRLDAEKFHEELQDVYVNRSITSQEKKLEITPEDFSQIISEEVMKDKLSTREEEGKKSKVFSVQKVKIALKKKIAKKRELKKKVKIEQKEERKIINENRLVDRLKEILEKHRKDFSELYLADNIPTNKMDNAKKKCEISEDETIIGILDLTLFGSAKNCFVFGKKGIYFHNSIFSKSRGRYFISYKKLKNFDFEFSGIFEIQFRENLYLNVDIFSILKTKRGRILNILDCIREIL